ncbi:MAG: hypothetical protein LBM20_02295 [Rikenellaceae bacterium]|jgi:DNA repair photolyase/flagellar biosynthesis protein FliQ|nr:hypothetical protein [Rikenellaceae bacterium]
MSVFIIKLNELYKKLVAHFKWATVVLALIIAIVALLIAIYIDDFEITTQNRDLIKTLALNFIPVCCTYIVTALIFNTFNNTANQIQNTIIKEECKLEFIKLATEANNAITNNEELIKLQLNEISLKEVEEIFYSYSDVEWHKLIKDAKEVDLCVFYMPEYWFDNNLEFFSNFSSQGGILNVYLPNPIEISNRYFEKSEVKLKTEVDILETYISFKKIQNISSIKMLNQGFNYMYARIKGDNNYFLLSPYSNVSHRGKAPTILFNEKHASEDLKKFIEKELEFLKNANEFIEFEKEKYIIWNIERNTVYISSGLSCDGSCKFCYTKSLVKKDELIQPMKLARCLSFLVLNDSRFEEGINGTTIMLGGFNDPFQEKHFEATCYLIERFKKLENPIHVSTRYNLTHKQLLTIPKNPNLVINYSISTLTDYSIEKNNQKERFDNAKYLINNGYNVALFLRPIIKDKTLKDIDKIIDKINESKIKVVTVGGLYVDERIRQILKKQNIPIDENDLIEKRFVLDDQNILKKINLNDIDDICTKLEKTKVSNTNLHIFKEAKFRVEFFKQIKKRPK